MDKFTITFLRHGESVGNAESRLQGQADYPLTENGLRQARHLAAVWQSEGMLFDWILSSPLNRARQTAETIAEIYPLPVLCDPDWVEQNFGMLEGMPLAQIDQLDPPIHTYHPCRRIGEHGESQMDLYLRAGRAVKNLLSRQPGRYLVVSHGAILNMAMYAALGLAPQENTNGPRFRFGNTGYAQFAFDPTRQQWRMLSLNNR